MDPRDVNRINYNNYYVGQNLDFLVRSKMRSESLSTPLKNTPPFYDDEVSSKMSLLGKRGYYDPGYIYGFMDINDNKEINQNEQNSFNKKLNEDPNSLRNNNLMHFPREYNNKEQILDNNDNNNHNNYQKYVNEVNSNNNENIYRNNNQYNEELLYRQKVEALKKVQTPQKLDNFQLDRVEKNNQNNNNNIEKEYINNNINNGDQKKNEDLSKYGYDINEEDRIYYEELRRNNNGMIRNEDKIPNQDYYKQIREYNYINELSKKNVGDFVLPLTKNQILQGVLTQNNNKKHFSK
jgi:hypothetical protein